MPKLWMSLQCILRQTVKQMDNATRVLHTSIHDFSDCLLLKIFLWLEIRDLVRACFVCTRWKRVGYDSMLWADVDLGPFRWRLDEQSIVRLIQSRLKPCLSILNLSGFSLTPKIFCQLEQHCPNMVALILENATFIGFDSTHRRFPSKLKMLDLRYASGDVDAFKLVATHLSRIRCFGVTNQILEHASIVNLFEQFYEVTTLDFSYCNSLYDATLILVGTFCVHLQSLSLSHCNNVNGAGLYIIIQNCEYLKALSFSGTSLTDFNLKKCNWIDTKLEELDVSWCRNITEAGLLSILPYLKHLIYLRLCSCGFGHAITDRVLRILSSDCYSKLELLDLSYSREITNQGTSLLIRSLPALRQIRLSCCRRLTIDLLQLTPSVKRNILILASFRNEQNKPGGSTQNDNGSLSLVPDLEVANQRTMRQYSFERELKRY